MKTFILKKEAVERKWYLVDAKDEILGRLASRIALVLQGKNKPSYTPNVDMSDFVVVINAEKIKVTGKKLKTKQYERHSTYPGGLKIEKFETLLNTKPAEVIKKAVKRMLPVNKLRDKRMKKLKIYKGSEHPHKSVKIEPINLTKKRTGSVLCEP
ncbi:MAG: 50S ribosomal protein L13 [Candidatus Omnitrophica bacterium]|nr:50S ribosomal protein L13 [Candidatus Omnitrophota bacterium]MBU1047096.1 50S ribosomal protein L13 [Candidatus Omnitrophota bacterium]MBU1631548.1 50S ribosomal protein L13 [Candidatus Omnitrophota bacterium]MBU1767716.1 50S ribosomal protein L13 [Candidatus Omnitrophota bacterium]MBU1888762.1 50S ribosomal protein L13 [Candidatus Omnitrophota bacterium]